ncbi:MAG: class IV adenylate cyclase [Patescibacteria group bacterium]
MKEYEIKLKIDNPEEWRKKIINLKGKLISKNFEYDISLDKPNHYMKKRGDILRIKKIGNDVIIGYKSRKKKKDYKLEEEIEVKCSNLEKIISIFKRLGYTYIRSEIEKIRETYLLSQGKVTIDRLPKIGYFLEVEAQTKNNLLSLIKKLGINRKEIITERYGKIIKKYLRSIGLKGNTLVF